MENENKAKIDLPAKYRLQECSLLSGIISFLCPKCKKECTLQQKSFLLEKNEKENGIMATDQSIKRPRMPNLGVSFGIFIGIIVAIILLAQIKYPSGKLWISAILVGYGAYWLSKTIVNNILSLKLPVWITNCNSCSETIVIASNGSKASLVAFPRKGDSAKPIEDRIEDQCKRCKEFYPKYELRVLRGELLCPDCRKSIYK